jgi:hypothetical protein
MENNQKVTSKAAQLVSALLEDEESLTDDPASGGSYTAPPEKPMPTEAEDEAEDASLHDMDATDLIEKWQKKNHAYHLEGDRGVRNLEQLVEVLDNNYSSLDYFLADNSGCMEAMLEWITEWVDRSDEWKYNLSQAVTGPSEDRSDE